MSGQILSHGRVEAPVPAGASIAVYTAGTASISQKLTTANHPDSPVGLGQVIATQVVFGPYANGAVIVIEATASPVEYSVGVAPTCPSALKSGQGAVGALNATGPLTAALMVAGMVTSSTAAAVVATVPTGPVMDTAIDFNVNDSCDWSAINTGPSAFTVTASAGHTLVGAAVVATLTSGRFRTRRTAVQTWITYRLS